MPRSPPHASWHQTNDVSRIVTTRRADRWVRSRNGISLALAQPRRPRVEISHRIQALARAIKVARSRRPWSTGGTSLSRRCCLKAPLKRARSSLVARTRRRASLTAVRSVQAELAVDRAQLSRLDQPRVRHHHGMDRSLERRLPEVEKLLQRREI